MISEIDKGKFYLGTVFDLPIALDAGWSTLIGMANDIGEYVDLEGFLGEDNYNRIHWCPIDERCTNAGILNELDKALHIISMSLNPVFVFCVAGKSRSPATAVAYMCTNRGMTLWQAYLHVFQRRSEMAISPFVSEVLVNQFA